MTISPQEIQSKQFHVRLRGFDVDEVDKFLEKISEEFLLLSLEHKQAFERIDSLEKEIANYRNKEQAFQTAILSAHRISDEMQERSRRESEETVRQAREEAAALETNSRAQAEAALQQAAQEAEALKEQAEKGSRETVAELSAKIVLQTAEVNRLVALKEAIAADLRHLLESHLQYLEEGTPPGLVGLAPLPDPNPALLAPQEPDATATFTPTPLQAEPWNGAAVSRPEEESIYERIEFSEELSEPEPMAAIGADSGAAGEEETLEITDIEGLDLEDIPAQEGFTGPSDPAGQRAALDTKQGEMFFTLEDPLDDLEPSVSIHGSGNPKRR